jgi:geranylgeranyl diphosphate synthase type I
VDTGTLLALLDGRLRATLNRVDIVSPVREMLLYHFGYLRECGGQAGKRLKPQVLLRTALGEGAALDDCLDIAVALELLHNYSLVHDDIQVGDEIRRGQASVWKRYGVNMALTWGMHFAHCVM